MDVQAFFLLILFALVGLFLFSVYFVFKQLGFFINATRLYRRMIHRQDAIIKLLLDIRDNTKSADLSALEAPDDDEDLPPDEDAEEEEEEEEEGEEEGEEEADRLSSCYHCGADLNGPAEVCPSCGKGLGK